MRICAADDCDIKFDPVSPIQLYHSKQCKWRSAIRRHRAKNGNGTQPTPPNGHGLHALGKKKQHKVKRLLREVAKEMQFSPAETERLITGTGSPLPPSSEKNQPHQDVLFA